MAYEWRDGVPAELLDGMPQVEGFIWVKNSEYGPAAVADKLLTDIGDGPGDATALVADGRVWVPGSVSERGVQRWYTIVGEYRDREHPGRSYGQLLREFGKPVPLVPAEQ